MLVISDKYVSLKRHPAPAPADVTNILLMLASTPEMASTVLCTLSEMQEAPLRNLLQSQGMFTFLQDHGTRECAKRCLSLTGTVFQILLIGAVD